MIVSDNCSEPQLEAIKFALNCLNKILLLNDLKSKYIIKRDKMLSEKINVSEFLIWLFQDPKNRLQDLKLNPTLQLNFIANK